MHEGEEILVDPHLKNNSKYLDILNSLRGKKPHHNAAEWFYFLQLCLCVFIGVGTFYLLCFC